MVLFTISEYKKNIKLAKAYSRLRITSLAFIYTILAGCSGIVHEEFYKPLSPALPNEQPSRIIESEAALRIELRGVDIHVNSVLLSSKSLWVFGPFMAFPTFWEREQPMTSFIITLFIKAEPGFTVKFNPSDCTVLFKDGRALTPLAVTSEPSEFNEARQIEKVTLLPQRYKAKTWFGNLQYDVALTDLTPFALQLSTLTVNGQSIDIPPIPFVKSEGNMSR